MEFHKYPLGIIGNCAYLALIDKRANVRWMCWPRFDSSFVFGSLLDKNKGGIFSIQPATDDYSVEQAYLPNTNVLVTTFICEEGSFKVTDFAPRFIQNDRSYRPIQLFRKITPLEGTPRVKICCQPRGQYGELIPEQVFGSSHIRYLGLESDLRLTTDISMNAITNEQAFILSETKYLALTWGIPLEGPLKATTEDFLQKTKAYWRNWVRNTSVKNFQQKALIRSALTLKLHQYEDSGAIIAAATTSLPESPGSGRNWDYRFCWMRDAHYTLKALNDLGHFGILEDYARYIENIALAVEDRLHPLYPITNDRIPTEEILPLLGYDEVGPVRIGNQAYEHIQNDVYGQILVTILPLYVDERLRTSKKNGGLSKVVQYCLQMIEKTMNEPDNGLWEFRGVSQLHAYTFLFHWAGANAAKKIAEIVGDDTLLKKAEQLISESSEMIEACYDAERGVYVQAVGSPNLDASLLQLINMGYLDPKSEKAKRHVEVLEKELKAETGGLFYRYKHADDFGRPETTFLICAFWYVETLARMDRVEEALEIFNNLTKYGNHLGLLSEDVHAESGSQWGNFPQTYSHVGLINAAFCLGAKLDKAIYL